MEAKTRNRGRSSLASSGVTDTGKVLMLLGDEGDGEAALGPGKPILVLDEIESLQRKENRSHGSSGHRSGSERDADKNLGKNGLHEGRSNSDESPTGRGQSRSDLRSRKNTNNGPAHGARDLWMSFLVVENLDDSDQFILGRDFVRNFDVMIDLNNGLIRIRNPDRMYVKKPINRNITDENKIPIFLDRKVKLQPGQAVVAIFRMRNLNSFSDSKQVCLVPNPNSQSSVILGRSFSVIRNGLCVSVLLNTLDTTVSIQRGKKLGYALPMRTDNEETQNLKRYSVKDCPCHANKDKILKKINVIKSIHKLFSLKSETDDGLSSCSNFPECPSSYELKTDKPVLPEIEHLTGKIGEGDFEFLRAALNRNADVFSKHKADIGCCNFVEHEIELEEGAVPHREGARRMTPYKLEACRAEKELLFEYDMIEPSKLPWACGVVMAKMKGGSLGFVATFAT